MEIYTDGSCSQINHSGKGPGGFAAVVLSSQGVFELVGSSRNTTNNRMEMSAVARGLIFRDQNPEPGDCTVYSDSAYIVNCMNQGWYKKWLKNGWKTSANKPVENQDLWELIIGLASKTKAKFVKVKGHADNEYNNMCDRLAVEQTQKIIAEMKQG